MKRIFNIVFIMIAASLSLSTARRSFFQALRARMEDGARWVVHTGGKTLCRFSRLAYLNDGVVFWGRYDGRLATLANPHWVAGRIHPND